jgi:chromosome segregation ATPase
MSVYHSFHAVGEEIAALQRRRAELDKSGEAKRDEAGELRRQTEEMADAAAAAAQQRDEWNARIRQLDSAAAESDSSEGPPGTGTEAASTTSAPGLSAELRLRQLRASIREAREEFRRSSLEFRRESGRARLQAAALGLDAGNLCALAYLSSHRCVGNEGEGGDDDDNDDDQDGLAAALDTLAEMLDERHRRDRVLDDDDLDQDPVLWKRLDLQDEGVHELWEAYKQSKDRCEAAERERDDADRSLQEARRQVEERRQRLEPLRSQLDRVSRENRQLRSRIDGLRGSSSAGRRGPGDEEGAS